ncbi:hypothetical protein Taro_053686 [Colocasia esculenta]|uniref:LYR motif containing domain-containing protein n=1 Tax=Colocasia esculenta TaxID=4460 RepID=A0A843XLU4_COLES|nr:hypothetical protein [Colocasia esculenta]
MGVGGGRRGLVWATAEDLARNRGRVLSLYRQILRCIDSPDLPLGGLAARLARKAEVRTIFMVGSEERSLHNIADLIDAAESKEMAPQYLVDAHDLVSQDLVSLVFILTACLGIYTVSFNG